MAVESESIQVKLNFPIIQDHSYLGELDERGGINQVWGKDALDNAILMWLASFQGDILRRPTKGGYVRPLIDKPLSDDNATILEMRIRDGFSKDFRPYLDIMELEITPNYEERVWDIYMVIKSNDLKMITEVSEKIKARV